MPKIKHDLALHPNQGSSSEEDELGYGLSPSSSTSSLYEGRVRVRRASIPRDHILKKQCKELMQDIDDIKDFVKEGRSAFEAMEAGIAQNPSVNLHSSNRRAANDYLNHRYHPLGERTRRNQAGAKNEAMGRILLALGGTLSSMKLYQERLDCKLLDLKEKVGNCAQADLNNAKHSRSSELLDPRFVKLAKQMQGLARLLLLESQLSEKTHLEQDKCPDSDVVAALERKLQEKNTYIRGLEEKMKNISAPGVMPIDGGGIYLATQQVETLIKSVEGEVMQKQDIANHARMLCRILRDILHECSKPNSSSADIETMCKQNTRLLGIMEEAMQAISSASKRTEDLRISPNTPLKHLQNLASSSASNEIQEAMLDSGNLKTPVPHSSIYSLESDSSCKPHHKRQTRRALWPSEESSTPSTGIRPARRSFFKIPFRLLLFVALYLIGKRASLKSIMK